MSYAPNIEEVTVSFKIRGQERLETLTVVPWHNGVEWDCRYDHETVYDGFDTGYARPTGKIFYTLKVAGMKISKLCPATPAVPELSPHFFMD